MTRIAQFLASWSGRGNQEQKDCPSQEYRILEKSIGYEFTKIEWLEQALTHPSLASDSNNLTHNQRLEFLGDSVIGSVLASWLFRRFPHENEGELSRRKSLLVRGSHLSEIGRSVGLDRFLRLGKSERKDTACIRDAVVEDALEALIGAVFVDGGQIPAERLILSWIPIFEKTLKNHNATFNPKGRLQELLQSMHRNPKIRYRVTKVSGPDHSRHFEVELSLNDQPISAGSGKSKKSAEEMAAKNALGSLQEDLNSQS